MNITEAIKAIEGLDEASDEYYGYVIREDVLSLLSQVTVEDEKCCECENRRNVEGDIQCVDPVVAELFRTMFQANWPEEYDDLMKPLVNVLGCKHFKKEGKE